MNYMKYVLLIFVIISTISCTKKFTDTALCFTKLTGNVNENSLESTVIRII